MHHSEKNPEIAKIEHLAHTETVNCYQCGKCSAGCPMAEQMDVLPSQIIRLVQVGAVDEAARAGSVWQCVSCLTCSTRCPKSVNIAGVMDALKEIALEKKCVPAKFKRIVAFQKAFLNTIRRNGRTNEFELTVDYKIRGFLGDFNPILAMKDAELAPKMMVLGKLHPWKLGAPVKDKALVKRIFEKCGS